MGLAAEVTKNLKAVLEQEKDGDKGEEKVKCKNDDWEGERDDLKDGKCPKDGGDVVAVKKD